MANRYQGRRLNRPNDVVVKSDGSIYFTDPGAPDPALELDFAGVYRVSADRGAITLLARDFVLPNGLAFSPDESVLYIDDSRRMHIRAFDVQPNGMLALATDRVFCQFSGDRPGVPDGMKVDVEGNVYCAGPGGVWIIDASGKHLGTILTGAEQTTNCAWGGEDWKTLFITTRDTVARIQLKIAGITVPGKG
jgi:gluconolactonase